MIKRDFVEQKVLTFGQTKSIMVVDYEGGILMAKMGRPKSSSPKLRSVGIRLTDEESEKLKKYASKHNLTITEVLLKGMRLLLEQT